MKVETGDISNIMATGADVEAIVIDVGESGLTEHGWCVSTKQYPSVKDAKVNNGTKFTYGKIQNSITGLDPNTNYYIRPYLSGNGTTTYGKQIEFTTKELSFNINYPTINEILGTEQSYEISWAANFKDKINVELYRGNNLIKTIAEEIENTGVFVWTPENNLAHNEDYRLMISSSENLMIFAESPHFKIVNSELPEVITGNATNISYFSAKFNGEISNFGTSNQVIQHGHCWNTLENPTIKNDKTELGSRTIVGSFISTLDNLTHNTTYYVKAYATSISGTIYGEQVSFSTSKIPTHINDYEGNSYNTVLIGDQLWMAENLKSLKYYDGTDVTNSFISESYENYLENFGRLYPWSVAMRNTNQEKIQGICPDGWYIPSDEEFQTLTDFLGGYSVAGGKLKETGLDFWNTPNTGASNTSGFSALPAGVYSSPIVNIGNAAYFWTSTEIDANTANMRGVYYNSEQLLKGNVDKEHGHSIRCIKDLVINK